MEERDIKLNRNSFPTGESLNTGLQDLVTVNASAYSSLAEARQLKPELIQRMLQTLGDYGMVLFGLNQSTSVENAKLDLIELRKYFGNPMMHKYADADGHVLITSKPGVYTDGIKSPQSDPGQQSPHTDAAYYASIPPFIALFSVQPAVEGGQGIVVRGEEILKYMLREHPENLPSLFARDALRVQRLERSAGHALFTYIDGRVNVCYGDHEYNQTQPSEDSALGFKDVETYVKDSSNWNVINPKSGQIAIYRNDRLLHGRLKWGDGPGVERLSIRAWFDGNSSYAEAIKPGFALTDLENNSIVKMLHI